MRSWQCLSGIAAAVIPFVIVAVARAQPATTQSLEQKLIGLAPVLSSADKQTRTLDVQVVFDQGRWSFRGLYQAPDRYAVYVCDARDGTPLFVNIGERLLIYDPVDGVLRCARGVPEFDFVQGEKQYRLNFGAKAPGANSPSVSIDLRSLIRFPVKSSARALGEGRYALEQTTAKGNPMESQIDETRACPYVRIDAGDTMVFQPLRLNEPVDLAAFDMPTEEELERRFTVLEWPGTSKLANVESIAALMRLGMVRLAAHDAEARRLFEQSGLPPIDWAKVSENDRKLAPLLREMFPHAIAREPAPDTKPR